MNILGISRVHNSSITLLKNGVIDLHLENERLSNIKYDGFPFQSIQILPQHTDSIEKIGIAGVGPTVPCESYSSWDVYSQAVRHLNKDFFSADRKSYDFWQYHHMLHAACAFYNSGFDRALCVIEDGMGSEYRIEDPRFIKGTYGRENASCYLAQYPCNFQSVEKEVIVPFECDLWIDDVHIVDSPSPALAFSKTAAAFGFHELDAGKIMGMASYGHPDDKIPPIFIDGKINKSLFKIYNNDLRRVYLDVKTNPYLDTEDFQIRANFAYALQTQCQQYVLEKILRLLKKTGEKNLCLTGGFFLNCVANYEYLKHLPKDINLYVEPVSSDAGTSMGAAKFLWHDSTGDSTKRPQTHIYLGPKYQLDTNYIKYLCKDLEILETDVSHVAELISQKNIVAMFQGRSESGPRALGNRSILYDPRDPAGKDRVNTVKRREWFRPFAGTVLIEKTKEWFDLRGLDSSPFMMFAVDIIEGKEQFIPAIAHVDNTCRIQTLSKDQNPFFYELIQQFDSITGIPILLNTSFNLAGDCMVETIEHAVSTLKRSEIDYLYLPEFGLIIK